MTEKHDNHLLGQQSGRARVKYYNILCETECRHACARAQRHGSTALRWPGNCLFAWNLLQNLSRLRSQTIVDPTMRFGRAQIRSRDFYNFIFVRSARMFFEYWEHVVHTCVSCCLQRGPVWKSIKAHGKNEHTSLCVFVAGCRRRPSLKMHIKCVCVKVLFSRFYRSSIIKRKTTPQHLYRHPCLRFSLARDSTRTHELHIFLFFVGCP